MVLPVQNTERHPGGMLCFVLEQGPPLFPALLCEPRTSISFASQAEGADGWKES